MKYLILIILLTGCASHDYHYVEVTYMDGSSDTVMLRSYPNISVYARLHHQTNELIINGASEVVYKENVKSFVIL